MSDNFQDILFSKIKEEQQIRLARKDSNAFCEYVLKDAITGKYFKQAKIHKEIQNAITKYQYLFVEICRDHGKTSQLIGRVLYEIGKNTNLRFKFLSSNDATASKRVLTIRTHIDTNKRLHKVFPELKSSKFDWGKTSFTVQRKSIDPEPSFEACGILATGAGGRVDWLIVDDPVDERNAILNPALRNQVKDSFYNVWVNLCSPNSKIIVLCTPWHEDDLTHNLAKNEKFKHLSFKIDDKYNSIWEQRYSKQQLIEREKLIGKRAFARGFKLIAIAEGEQLFNSIEKCKDYTLNIEDVMNNTNWSSVIGIDLAISKRKGSAFTVIFIIRVDDMGKRYPVEVIRGKFRSITTALLIIAYNCIYQPDIVLCENNAYQDSILEWIELLRDNIKLNTDDELLEEKQRINKLEKKINNLYKKVESEISLKWWNYLKPFLLKIGNVILPLEPYTTTAKIADEQLGLPNFAAEIDDNMWIIPFKNHEDNCDCSLCVWITEMKSYPVSKFKDTVMASFFCQRALKIGLPNIREI